MRKDLGARAFGFGWPVPVLMVATYNDDGSVNVMNLHEAMRRNAGDLALSGRAARPTRMWRSAAPSPSPWSIGR